MNVSRLFDILDQYQVKYPDKKDALAAKIDGEWKTYSSIDYTTNAYNLSYGLLALGLKPGDKIATVSNNRPEWNFLDMAMSMAGIVHVPVYPTIGSDDFLYILKHAEPKLLVVSDNALYTKLEPITKKVDSINYVYTFNELDGIPNWSEILKVGEEHKDEFAEKLTKIKDSISPNDLATMIYTSGTTGNPKGVMLSHNNILANTRGIGKIFDFNSNQKTLSFLPISHVFERTINYYFQIVGVSVYYAESLGTIGNNLLEIKPNVLIAVPRVLETIYDRIIGKGKDLKGFKKRLFFWAVNLGLKYEFFNKNGKYYQFKLKLANKLIFEKWREAVGGRIEVIVTGGAAMQERIIRVFNAAGIPTVEGYGMTETSPVIAANDYFHEKVCVGTVGPVLPGVDVKINDDGEIMTRSECVMMGYYKDEAQTKETIEKDGWLHTGDIGEMVDGIYLKITDRKKEIFKMSNGKYIAPQFIENKFKESFFIEQIYVFGENQKFASALIVPNFKFLHDWCAKHGVKYQNNQKLVKESLVIKQFQKEVNAMNKTLGQTEHIKRFRLVADEWSTATGELSPTLKLKRRYLVEKYKDIINEIFSVDTIGK